VPDHNQPNSDANKSTNTNRNSLRAAYASIKSVPVGLWWILGGGVVGFLGILAIAIFHPSLAERWKFGADMALNLLVLLAIVIQVYINRRQWDSMNEALAIERAKTDPRLRVAEVVAENFDVGKRPFFIVTITNDGLLAASGVRIHMSIEIGNEKPMDWIHDQIVTIPANGREHYFVHSSFWLSQEQFDSFDKAGVPLRVVGFFEYAPVGVTNFCYKYVPLQGEYRPAKVPQFVPCDFTPRLNTTLIPGTGHLTLTGHAVIMTRGQVVPKNKEERESGDKSGDSTEPPSPN
jgi:hypothetical protein